MTWKGLAAGPISEAERLAGSHLLQIEERRVSRFRNLPNVVTIVLAELSTSRCGVGGLRGDATLDGFK